MALKRTHSLILLLVIGLIRSEFQHVCEICTCDNRDQPTIVQCDSRNLTTLSDLLFNDTIKTLTLTNNSLTFLSGDDLQIINNITSLEHLDLSENPLTIIPPLSLANLVELQLENTDLKSAYFPKSYENSSQLRTVSLSKNKLNQVNSDDFKSLTSLSQLSLDDAQLTSINQCAFVMHTNTLQTISLASNSLDSAQFLSNLNNLLTINLDQNRFKQLLIEMKNPQYLKSISIRNNQISTIDERSSLYSWMKANLTGLDVYLNGNSFDCCQSHWLINYLNESQNLVQDAMNLTCSSPKQYADQKLININANSIDCSIIPFDPSNNRVNQILIILFWLLCVVMISLILIGLLIHRSNTFHGRRTHHQGYETIDGDNMPISM